MHLGIDFGENPCSTCGKLLPTGLEQPQLELKIAKLKRLWLGYSYESRCRTAKAFVSTEGQDFSFLCTDTNSY